MLNTKRTLLLYTIIFLTANFTFAQSVRETYNDIYNRYEYHNSDNELVGYKKKDIITGDWVYTTVSDKSSNNSHRSPYRHLEPVDVFDEDLYFQALIAKRNASANRFYNLNLNKIIENINVVWEAKKRINAFGDHPAVKKRQQEVNRLLKAFNEGLEQIKSENIQYNNRNEAERVNDWVFEYRERLIKIHNEILEEIESEEPENNLLELNKKAVLAKLLEIEIDVNKLSKDIGIGKDNESSSKQFGDYINQLQKSVIEGRVDLSNSEVTSKFLDDLDAYHKKVITLRSNWEESKLSNVGEYKNPIETKILYGGYRTSRILEYDYNSITSKWELTLDEEIPSQLYFENNSIAFKRGDNDWLFAMLEFSQSKSKQEDLYIFYDNYNQAITFDKDIKVITWFSEFEGSVSKKMYRYVTLVKDENVLPPWH